MVQVGRLPFRSDDPARRAASPTRAGARVRRTLFNYAYVLPAAVIVFGATILPTLIVIWVSLHHTQFFEVLGFVRLLFHFLNPFRAPALDLLGLTGDRAKLLFWRHERLPVPRAYLRNPRLHEGLQKALRLAEDSARSLNGATRRLAELLISRDPNRRPDPKAVAALAGSMGAGRRYWARLGDHFTRFLGDQPAIGTAALRTWADEVRTAARTAFREVAEGQAGDGWSLRAVVEAERALNIGLAGARKRDMGDIEVTHAIA